MRNRYLAAALLALAVAACQNHAAEEAAAPPDQDWQALIASQADEIQRLEAEAERLQRGCEAPVLPAANVKAAPPESTDWQAVLKSQEEEIHRLEAEVQRLRRGCRESAGLEPEAPAVAADAAAAETGEPEAQGRPRISRFTVASPLSAGGRTQLVWKARLENPAAREQMVLAFEAFDLAGNSLSTWGVPGDLPERQAADYSKAWIVASVEKPARVKVILKTRAGDVATSTATVLDTSPPEPVASSSVEGDGRLVAIRPPQVQYTVPDIGVDFKVWNPSRAEAVTRTGTLQLLKGGQVIDQKTIYFENIPPDGEQEYGETFRNEYSHDPSVVFTARLVW